ncbi:MAG: EamA family transporter [Patescibacteria group bacterium]
MNWIFLSLAAPFFWAGSNFIDKYILEKHIKGIFDFLFFTTLTNWVFFFGIFLFIGMPTFSWNTLIPISTGLVLVYSYGFYGKALQQSDTSALVILFKLVPVITLALAFIFLGQSLAPHELFGFFVVLCGAFLMSFEKSTGKFFKGFWMILVAIVIWSVMTLVVDFGLTTMSFWEYFMLDNLGSALAGLTLLATSSLRAQISEGIRSANIKKYFWFSINGLLDFFGQMSIKMALAIAPSAGLVMAVTQVQSFYAILIGIFATILLPNIIREDISKTTLMKKVFGASVMFAGIFFILVL